MSLTILVSFTLFSSLAFTAVVLPASIPLDNALRPRQPLSNTSLLDSIINTTSPPSDVLQIKCTSDYGRNVNPSSCRDVFHYIGRTEQENTLAQRQTGHPNAIPLPLRFLSDDGLCFVQPLLKPGLETARASSKQMGQAGYTLFQRCVVEKGLGGIANNIGVSFFLLKLLWRFLDFFFVKERNPDSHLRQSGGDNNLNVVVSGYEPHVRCDKSSAKGPPWESCLLILADMAATWDRKVFGVKSQDARVEVNLPFYYKASELKRPFPLHNSSSLSMHQKPDFYALPPFLSVQVDARCQLEIGIAGKSTSTSWYEIWEAASALAAMCVRAHEKGGKAFGIGDYNSH